MQTAVGRIGEPQFLFIWSKSDTVTWATMSFRRSLLPALHFHAIKHLARVQIAEFEAKQIVHIHKAKRAAAIHREWTNEIAERPNFPNDRVRFCVGNAKQWRFQPGQICMPAIQCIDRIVRAGFRNELLQHLT